MYVKPSVVRSRPAALSEKFKFLIQLGGGGVKPRKPPPPIRPCLRTLEDLEVTTVPCLGSCVHRKPSLVKQLSPKTSFALSLLTVLRARTFALSRKRADDPIVRYLSVGTSI